MPALTRAILNAALERQPLITKYSIPSPDGRGTIDVWCRDMDSGPYSYMELIDSMSNAEGKPNKWRQKHLGELIAVHSLCDEAGELLFDEATLKSDAWRRSFTGFKTAAVQIARLHNGLQLGDIEASEKNSDEAAPGDSPSA